MSRTCINERSECYATATYIDVDKVPFTPTAVRYRVDDLTNQVNVVPWAILVPGLFNRITITSAQNGMSVNEKHTRETRQIVFEITAPGGGVRNVNAEYDLVRLFGVP